MPASDGSGISQPYIVMEFVAGRTLRDILREGRKILPERALEISSGVLSALDYSHRAGIIHRDIKPGNVMLTPAGDVKVMDFGIARAISDASSTMTQTAAVVGTAQYLSPEQARGEPVDSRSDVYSAGCLLYELLTGRPPFIGDSPVAVAYQHVREPAAPPSDHDTDLPPEVDAIVMKSLAKRVEDRYQSAAAMRGDIERYLAGHPVHVTPPPPLIEPPTTVTNPTTVVTPVPPPEEPVEEEERGTRPGLLVFLAILLVIVLGLAAYLLPKMFASPTDQVQVPRLAGLTDAQARAKLTDAGLQVGTADHAYSTKVAPNRVIDQNPAADEFVDKGTTVTYTLSLGTHPTKVPPIVGQPKSEAQSALQNAHLNPVFQPVDSDQPKGTVVSTDPPAGTKVARDSDVTVSISRGPQKVPERGRAYPGRGRADDQGPRLHPAGEPGQQLDRDPGHGHRADARRRRDTPAGLDGLHPGVDLQPDLPADVASQPRSRPRRRRPCRPRRRPERCGAGRGDDSAAGVALRQHLGVLQVGQAVVRGRGHLVLDLLVPADVDVGIGGVGAVDLEIGVVGDRVGQLRDVADGLDPVRLAVGDPLELHGVADAADAGGARPPASLGW